jgi:hypothetical protein
LGGTQLEARQDFKQFGERARNQNFRSLCVMSEILNAYDRALARFSNGDIGSRIRADDSIFNHSDLRVDSRRVRITTPAEYAGTKRAISRFDWNQGLSLSRQLYARIGELSGATKQKSNYVIGDSWCAEYHGPPAKAAWGELAKEWLENWFLVANIRGEPFDFVTSLFVDSIAIDRDGDAGMIPCVENGEPRLQFIPAHQIGFRQSAGQDVNGLGIVPDGRFKGAKCYNGVVFGNRTQVLGYGVLGESPKDDKQFAVSEMQLLYEPDWSDQGRGIPKIANSMPTWMDYEDIVHFIKRQVKMDSAQGLMHYNEEGAAEDSQDFITGKASGASNQDVKIEQLEGNEIMYFKALGGGKIEAFRSDRPHPNTDAHNMRLLRGCFLSLEWPYELYDPKEVGGASTRLIQDFARHSVNKRQRLVWKRFIRAIAHGLSYAMENGDIPRNDDPDWLAWEVTLPAKVTVDARYDDKTKMEKIRIGAGTWGEIYGDDGKSAKTYIWKRCEEESWWQEASAHYKVDVDKCRILTPNGNQLSPDDGAEEDPKKKESK